MEAVPQDEQSMVTDASVKNFEQAEWCFQFFDAEPVVFAWSEEDGDPGELVLSINPNESSSIVFSDKGMSFKLFCRPMSEETKFLRSQKQNA